MNRVEITPVPSGKKLTVEAGTRLREALAADEVEFACDGQGECGSCRVQVIEGILPVAPARCGDFKPR